jgi:ArsR family transcriptional regulator
VAHPLRLRIVELLESGEKSVTELKDLLGATQPLTSQHLSQMRMRGVREPPEGLSFTDRQSGRSRSFIVPQLSSAADNNGRKINEHAERERQA